MRKSKIQTPSVSHSLDSSLSREPFEVSARRSIRESTLRQGAKSKEKITHKPVGVLHEAPVFMRSAGCHFFGIPATGRNLKMLHCGVGRELCPQRSAGRETRPLRKNCKFKAKKRARSAVINQLFRLPLAGTFCSFCSKEQKLNS